jgi:PAS domain S-box-containing protein
MSERGDPPVSYQGLVEHLPVVVYIASDDRPMPRTIYISPNAEQVLGHRAETIMSLGDGWVSLLHPDDARLMRATFADTTASREPFDLEYRWIHPDGREIWVRDYAVLMTDPKTGIRVWQGTLEDISARVDAERSRDESDVRYETLIENLPAVVYDMDPDDDRRTRYVNRKIEELLGYTMEEWLDQPDMWIEVLHPDDREVELAAHDLHSATGDPWLREYRLIGADGNIVWVRDQATLVRDPDGNPEHWQGVMVDITAEKEAQRALEWANDELEFRVRARTAQLEQANEAMGLEIAERIRAEQERDRASGFLDQVMKNVPAVVYLWQTREREDGQSMAYVGDQITPMLGYTPEEWNQSGWRDRVHPHDRERVEAAAERSLEHGTPFRMEYRYLARDGRVVWVVDHASLVLRNDAGEPLLFEGVMVDVTAQREAEAAAETAADRLRDLVELGPAILYGYSVSGDPPVANTDYISPQFAEVLGVPASEVAHDPRRWFDRIHPDDRDAAIERSEYAWRTGASWDNEYRMLDADGQIVWVWDRGRCVRRTDAGEPHRFVGSVVDVTARRNTLDDVTRQLEAMDALHRGIDVALWTWVLDPTTNSFRYTYYSAATATILGYTPEELMSERDHFTRLIHPDDFERVMTLDAESNATGIWDATYRVVHRDGHTVWIHSRGWRGTGPEPEAVIWHGVAYEVAAPTDEVEVTGGGTAAEGPPADVTPAVEVRPPA